MTVLYQQNLLDRQIESNFAITRFKVHLVSKISEIDEDGNIEQQFKTLLIDFANIVDCDIETISIHPDVAIWLEEFSIIDFWKVFPIAESSITFGVQLASNRLELDSDGVPVPADFQTLFIGFQDNVLPKKSIIADHPEIMVWLDKDYSIIDFWEILDTEPEF